MTIPYGSLAVTVDVSVVVATAAHAFGETVEDLIGPSRKRPLATHRAIAMAAAREMGYSYPKIAQAFGRQDHKSVLRCVAWVRCRPEMIERARIIAGSAKEGSLF